MASDGQALHLDGPPKVSLLRSKLLLDVHMTPEELGNVRLGGGTALAMRWRHRLSTDIDFAMQGNLALAFINRVRDALSGDLRARKAKGELRKFRVGWRTAMWLYTDSGPVSLSASDYGQGDGMDWESDTKIAVAPTRDILRGKLFGRVLDGNRLLARDGYDLCAAFRHDIEAVRGLIEEAKRYRGEDLSNICQLVVDSGRRIIEGRPLLGAIHDDLAHDPWREFVRLVETVPVPDPPSP
ncbi:MAG: nucleotidyl transferase AbiEii/AbiGii toxin family protein [Gammaproteobacteria bacterium]|nr:nucleotidyl transferase AbiEii/AbiGii toxin family protein [Gammaproteobacteria bacterium]MCY4343426.1 nucleotidyl transferase AbiEii/AbiGii toxin family protein [Gammaproteobacteria bacterium]